MYAVGEEIYIPDISDYFSVAIAAEEIISAKGSRLILKASDTHMIFVEKPENWQAVRAGEYPKNFASIMDEYAIYEAENGILIPSNKVIVTFISEGNILDRLLELIELHGISSPLALYTGKGNACVIEPSIPRYLCFKVAPRGRRARDIEQIEVEYFWEIVSYALTSDRKTIFEVRMKL